MTIQNSYKQELNVEPAFPDYYLDDTTFAHIFTIPTQYHTLDLSANNAIDNFQETVSVNDNIQTIDLYGRLILSSSNVFLEAINADSVILLAGHNTNSIIFDYVDNPIETLSVISEADTIMGLPITRVVNLIGKHCYLEYTGNISFYANQIVVISGISIKILAGSGIVDRFGVVGTFSTDFKRIFYYAKFSPTIVDKSSSIDYANYNLSIVNPFVNNNKSVIVDNDISTDISSNYINERLNEINTSIITPAANNISSINTLSGGNFSSTVVSIDGTSDLNNALSVKSWLHIPHKSHIVSFGINNITPRNGDNTYVQSAFTDIIIRFNWIYQPQIIPYEADIPGKRIIDGWLTHTYSYTEELDIPPSIIYNKDGAGFVSRVGFINDTDHYVLFAGNDVIYNLTTHTLDYEKEPVDSSTITNLRGIQNQVNIPCKYTFAVENIKTINDNGGNTTNIDNIKVTQMTAPFLMTDYIIRVKDASQFFNSGYLQICVYTVDTTIIGLSERRTYNLVGLEIVKYQNRDDNNFYGIARGFYGTSAFEYPMINSSEIIDWYYEVVSYYPVY